MISNTNQAPQLPQMAVSGSALINQKELLMCIQSVSILIARKKQKSNRRQRILKDAEQKCETGLHQLRRNVFKGIEEIKEFEILKEKLENDFNKN